MDGRKIVEMIWKRDVLQVRRWVRGKIDTKETTLLLVEQFSILKNINYRKNDMQALPCGVVCRVDDPSQWRHLGKRRDRDSISCTLNSYLMQ
jgi:hypothetical protein